jgi:two-component system response regulator FimZ (fimbrial Z protein)/two-component system response regulator EvgA
VYETKNIDCLIIDDHPLVCFAIEDILKKVCFISSLQSIHCPKQALDVIKHNNVDLILLDINLGNSDGFDLLRRAKAHGFKGKTIIISASKNPIHIKAAQKVGADGYVCKSEGLNTIREAIDNILKGYVFFKALPCSGYSLEQVDLSHREVIVYNFLIQGKSNKDISKMLSISTKTVSTYKRRILDKYTVSNVFELINATCVD